jgi:hypothetical protein
VSNNIEETVGRRMSESTRQTSGMKILPSMNSWTVVATFGSAQIVVKQNDSMELRGGTNSDQISAREWISLFMHEAVLRIQRN